MRNRMTFCKRRVCRASAKDELQTIGRPPGQLGGAGRSADCSQLYALQFYTARCKHSALRAPCSQRFTPESGALRPTLMPEASVLPTSFFTSSLASSIAIRSRRSSAISSCSVGRWSLYLAAKNALIVQRQCIANKIRSFICTKHNSYRRIVA